MGPDWIVVQEMKDSGLRGPSVVLVFRRGWSGVSCPRKPTVVLPFW
jgi:hypothetical protein